MLFASQGGVHLENGLDLEVRVGYQLFIVQIHRLG